jgi:ribosomal protein S18 acetylase RimI-like enzyme
MANTNLESVVAMKAFYRFRITPARRFEHLSFNLLSFHFFKNSEGGNLLFFGSPRLLSPLTVIPYILAMEVILFRSKRYFIKLKEQVVGMFVIREKLEALYINSLAVAPEHRRLGIATYILNHANNLAKQLDKKWLELSVLKVNIPALRLYMKLGFAEKEEKKLSLILKKPI